jgi:hypothetical protein
MGVHVCFVSLFAFCFVSVDMLLISRGNRTRGGLFYLYINIQYFSTNWLSSLVV